MNKKVCGEGIQEVKERSELDKRVYNLRAIISDNGCLIGDLEYLLTVDLTVCADEGDNIKKEKEDFHLPIVLDGIAEKIADNNYRLKTLVDELKKQVGMFKILEILE